MVRRSLSPPNSVKGILAQRRLEGGERVEITSTVTLTVAGEETVAWTLNKSKGGIRVISEARFELGQVMLVFSDDLGSQPVRARVAWVQEEPDGTIAGLEFINPPSDPP